MCVNVCEGMWVYFPFSHSHMYIYQPGYYEDGRFGIRIESVLVTRRAPFPSTFGDTEFLEFENFTCVPIQTKLVNSTLLDAHELQWLNAYNASVREKVWSGLWLVP